MRILTFGILLAIAAPVRPAYERWVSANATTSMISSMDRSLAALGEFPPLVSKRQNRVHFSSTVFEAGAAGSSQTIQIDLRRAAIAVAPCCASRVSSRSREK